MYTGQTLSIGTVLYEDRSTTVQHREGNSKKPYMLRDIYLHVTHTP
jgi:hypothetical protein